MHRMSTSVLGAVFRGIVCLTMTSLLAPLTLSQIVPNIGTIQWLSKTYQATRAEVVQDSGKHIRTRWNNGCLDAGCCSLGFRQVEFNENCPPRGWLKWSFDGPMLRAHKPFIHMCLECEEGARDCVVGTSRCSGIPQQQWHIQLQLRQTTQNGDILFTINSDMFPDQCVTIDESSEQGGLVMRNCTHNVRQLFYINRDWFQTATMSQKIVDFDATQKLIEHASQQAALDQTESEANIEGQPPLKPLRPLVRKTYANDVEP